MRSLENAREESRQLQVPLYLVQAHDEAVRQEDRERLTPLLRAELLRRVNPDSTKALPSFLPLYIGMRVILASKDCARIGIMKGWPCVIGDIILPGDEILPDRAMCGDMHTLKYLPVSLLLYAEGAQWVLPRSDLPSHLPQISADTGYFSYAQDMISSVLRLTPMI